MLCKLAVVSTLAFLSLSTASAVNAANFTWGPNFTITNGSDYFDAFGSTIKCTSISFDGEIPQFAPALILSPTYSNCTGFGLPTTVTTPNDAYSFTADGTVHINEKIAIHVYSSAAHTTTICHVTIPAQTPSGKVNYTNNEDGSLTISGSISGMTMTQNRTNAVLCPAGTHNTTGSYTIAAGGIVIKDETGTVSFHVK